MINVSLKVKNKCKVILFSELREYHTCTKLFSGSGRGGGQSAFNFPILQILKGFFFFFFLELWVLF